MEQSYLGLEGVKSMKKKQNKEMKNNGYCLKCSMMLVESKVFSLKFCGNPKCPREGLLTYLLMDEPFDPED